MVDFSSKTIVVTGGAQGIGRGISEYLLERKGKVIIADIDIEAGQELTDYLAQPDRALFVPTDVGDEQSVIHCLTESLNFAGRIDGLVNNAGLAHPGRTPLIELSLDSWEKMLRTNLTGCFLMVKHTAPHMMTKGGAIVNIASTRALQSEADTEAYSASKGGLLALTHALAVSLGSRIRVNAVLPGWIDVSSWRKSSARIPATLSPDDHLQHPAGRVGTVDDIAAMTAFLLSEEAGFITGQQFIVDGGMTRKMIYCE